MVRNGNEKKIKQQQILHWKSHMVRNGHGTKRSWCETVMVPNGFSHGTKWMVRNGHGTKRLATA